MMIARVPRLAQVINLYITMLVSTAWLTLLERKFLSIMQSRKGPDKCASKGFLQPIADAVKLLGKTNTPLSFKPSKLFFMMMSPVLYMVTIFTWSLSPNFWGMDQRPSSILMLAVSLSMSVFMIYIAGWISTCIYSMIGGTRALFQSISYELVFFMLFLIWMALYCSDQMDTMMDATIFSILPASVVWLTCSLAETNRIPFDMPECESELTSGFNTEFSGTLFSFFFLAEYSMTVFMALLTAYMASPGDAENCPPMMMLCMLFFIWTRGTVPRIRFDTLLDLAWMGLLPLTLLMLAAGLLAKL